MQETIQSTRNGETITWDFPARNLGALKPFGWAGVGIGLFAMAFMALWMGMPLWWGIQAVIGGQLFGLAFIAFAAMGLAGMRHAIRIFRGGLAILRDQTQCRVELSATHLKISELLGGARLNREVEIDNIDLLILDDLNVLDGSYRAGGLLGANDLECLTARLKKKKNTSKGHFPVIIGYPPEMLQEFGEVLVSETQDRQEALQLDAGRYANHSIGPIRRESESDVDEAIESEVRLVRGVEAMEISREQPADSDIVVREDDGTLAFQVPPTGLMKGSHGLFIFALLWLGFMTFFTIMMAVGNNNAGGGNPDEWGWVFGLAMVSVFWLVGIVMLICAINLGKRSLMLGIMDDMLFVERKSIFGKQWIQYQIDELDSIDVGPSGMEVNDVPVNELQLIPREGNTLGILSQRDDSELAWLASRLRDATGLVQGRSNSWQRLIDEPEQLDAVTVPKVTVISIANGCEIRIDEIGYRKMIFPAIFCFVFMGIGVAISAFALKEIQAGGIGTLIPAIVGFMFFAFSGITIVSLFVSYSRHFLIKARNDSLTVDRLGPLSRASFRWNTDEIKSVTCSDSGAKVNRRALHQLLIQVRGSTGLKMMLGRERSEIEYVVAQIHRAMPDLSR